jgi:predicted enzyme related to lactoylglutathione lyase
VWFEHTCGDTGKAQAFYGEVLEWKAEPGNDGYDMILAGDELDSMIGGYAWRRHGLLSSGVCEGAPHWLPYVAVDDPTRPSRWRGSWAGRST